MANADAQTIGTNFTEYAAASMGKSLKTITKCVDRLSEQQLQARGAEHENSVVNLLVHLEGNIRQWVLHGVAEQPDVRVRDAEFATDISVSGSEALAKLAGTVAESQEAIRAVTPERLLEVIDPQPTGIVRNLTVLESIAKVFSHLDHHTGQIILLTKQMAGTALDLSMPRKR